MVIVMWAGHMLSQASKLGYRHFHMLLGHANSLGALGATHLLVDRVNQDGLVGVRTSHQVGVGAAVVVKQLPEDYTVDDCKHCKRKEMYVMLDIIITPTHHQAHLALATQRAALH